METTPVGLTQYSTINDTLGYLGDRAVITVTVSLWHRANNYNNFFYKELQFSNQVDASRKLTRNYSAYLLIKYMTRRDEPYVDHTVVLNSNTLEMMRFMVLPRLEEILFAYNEIYEKRGNKFYINNPNNKYDILFNVNSKSSIIFQPSLHKIFNSDEVEPAIDMYFDGTQDKTTMNINSLMGLVRIIRLFNIEQHAATMLASVQVPLGTNITTNIMSNNGYARRSSSDSSTNIFNVKGATNIKQIKK